MTWLRALRPTSGEAGFTLIEVLWAMGLSIIVIGVPLAWIVSSLTQQDVVASRSAAARQAGVGLERLTRDLRQVVPNTITRFTWSGSAASISMTLPQPGTQGGSTQSVNWSCSFGNAGTCTRQVGAGGPSVPLITNVESLTFSLKDASGNPVASGQTSPPAVFAGLTLSVLDVSQLDSSGSPGQVVHGVGNYITVQDGVNLRANSL
jgi:Tfp pilus assembly protein PilW